jgi:hypothetical protein
MFFFTLADTGSPDKLPLITIPVSLWPPTLGGETPFPPGRGGAA